MGDHPRRFEIGDVVFKHTGDYTGPGIVRGVTMLPGGKLRYLVGHVIEGGRGEFLHIYSQGNLRTTSNTIMSNTIMDEDMKWRDEHHQRQMVLMRELGKVNRMETRMYMPWAVAVLLVLALVGMAS